MREYLYHWPHSIPNYVLGISQFLVRKRDFYDITNPNHNLPPVIDQAS